MERITLRIPDDLHKELKQRAEKNNRSLNAQIVTYLQHSLWQINEMERQIAEVRDGEGVEFRIEDMPK